jgi:DNA-binding response OmpR family regulator
MVRILSIPWRMSDIMNSARRRGPPAMKHVFTCDQPMDLVYPRRACMHDTPAYDRTIDVRIGRVRKKLADDSANPRFIRTARNGG